MAKIDVISSCLIQMSKNEDSDSSSKMHLTPWDLQFLLLDPIQKGILFHKPSAENSQDFDHTIINQFKISLSRTLDFFPPIAGRLGTSPNTDNTTSYFIDCNNAGVEFTHAVARGMYVSDILEPVYIPKFVSSFFPLDDVPNYQGTSKPLVGVQVTELVDGYFIGLTANHSILDGTSFWHFINSWSEISRVLDTISKKPIFERWFPTNIMTNYMIPLPPLDPSHQFVPPPLLEKVFHFSKENLAKLKSRANLEAGTGSKISTLQALSAHLSRSVVRCRHLNNVPVLTNEEVVIMILVGTRARIPLPDGYFGNAVYGAKTTMNEHELLNNGLGYVALKVNELVDSQTSEAAIKVVEDWVKSPVIHRKVKNIIVISSSPRFNVYGNDFGWGKPIAVRSGKGQKSDGKMTVFPAVEPGGGIDVQVCLAPVTLRAIEEDAEFMEIVTR